MTPPAGRTSTITCLDSVERPRQVRTCARLGRVMMQAPPGETAWLTSGAARALAARLIEHAEELEVTRYAAIAHKTADGATP